MQAVKAESLTAGKKYYYHINGLKGFACLLILVGHYLGLYKFAESFVPQIHILDVLINSRFAFLLDEAYWLYLFFVVSGYLVAKSRIAGIKELFIKSVNRFMRLALPILFSYLIIYLIYITVGFHATETDSIFQCSWFQLYFYTENYTIKDVLLGPVYVLLYEVCPLNKPYWVLRMMFFSSLLIYLLKLLFTRLNSPKYEAAVFSMLIVITLASYKVSPIMTACLAGMLVSFYEDSEIKTKACYAFWFLFISMSLYIMPKVLIPVIFFAALIIFVPRIRLLDAVFSSGPFQFAGKLSWGIYSFHWPLICSVGALLLIRLTPGIGLAKAYALTFVLIVLLTFVLSVFFYYTFERFSSLVTKKLSAVLRKVLNVAS